MKLRDHLMYLSLTLSVISMALWCAWYLRAV